MTASTLLKGHGADGPVEAAELWLLPSDGPVDGDGIGRTTSSTLLSAAADVTWDASAGVRMMLRLGVAGCAAVMWSKKAVLRACGVAGAFFLKI